VVTPAVVKLPHLEHWEESDPKQTRQKELHLSQVLAVMFINVRAGQLMRQVAVTELRKSCPPAEAEKGQLVQNDAVFLHVRQLTLHGRQEFITIFLYCPGGQRLTQVLVDIYAKTYPSKLLQVIQLGVDEHVAQEISHPSHI